MNMADDVVQQFLSQISSFALDTAIKGLPDFGYTDVRPIAYRPFLAKRHLSMGRYIAFNSHGYLADLRSLAIGISNCLEEDWIQIDKDYLDRITERKRNLVAHPEAIEVNEVCIPAVTELFIQVIKNILIRYPTVFCLEGTVFRNHVTGAKYDLVKIRTEPRRLLQMLSENVEEDFYLMYPDEDGIFSLQRFVSCFPNGFSSREKLGQSMRDVHGPVPGLNEGIGNGIDRFMTGLQFGTVVQRLGVSQPFDILCNILTSRLSCVQWSLQFNGSDLWRTGGNNFYPKPGEVLPDVSEYQDIAQCYLRVERQTLVRLENSKAVVFGIRQYMTPIEEIKEEGNGPALVDAIASLPEELGYYKMRPFWQRDVDFYLRK